MSKLLQDVGVDAFTDHKRANALVNDYFNGSENAKTCRLLKYAVDVDAFSRIARANSGDLNGVCREIKKTLVDEESLAEEPAETVIGWVCGALRVKAPVLTAELEEKEFTESSCETTPNVETTTQVNNCTPLRGVPYENRITWEGDLEKLEGSNATFYLMTHIDLRGKSRKPINGFSGTLYGTGYTIRNFQIKAM